MTGLRKAAIGLTALYGLVALIGGTIGYVSAGSLASLIAGGVAGLLLLASAGVALRRPVAGLLAAFLVSLALVGRFAKVAFDQQQISLVAAVMIGGGLVVIAAAGLALMRRVPPTA